MLAVEDHRIAIKKICEQFPVERLALFGSALTGRFGEPSDVDVLVEFEEGDDIDYFRIYFRLKEALEGHFNRPVDLIVDRPFRNPVFQQSVDRTRKTVYERRSA